jgi:hypothetical protein
MVSARRVGRPTRRNAAVIGTSGSTNVSTNLCKRGRIVAPAALCIALAVSPAHGQDGALAGMFEDGTLSFAFRFRSEHVDQDAFGEDARASTLRSRIAFQSGELQQFRFMVEVDDIREIGWRDFNAGGGNTPRRAQYPVVADVAGTEVNQAYLDFTGIGNTTVRAGRQRINLDNQRFVGAVGWRQNEQTFDALSVRYNVGEASLLYAWVDTVRTIFGERSPVGAHRQSGTHLLNASTALADIGRLSGYLYEIDNDTVVAHSSRTTGLRFVGAQDGLGVPVHYELEYAWQRDAGGNPVSYRADYLHLAGGVDIQGWRFTGGFERLDGDRDRPGRAFRTPLATLHAFNGRTDKFLATPPAGLEDRYARLQTNIGQTRAELRYNHFSAADGNATYGREVSLAVGRAFGRIVRGDLIAAAFSGRGGFDDTTKLWLMLTANF